MKTQVLLLFRSLSGDHVRSIDRNIRIEILAKLVFSFTLIILNMMKLLVILFIMHLISFFVNYRVIQLGYFQ